MIKSLKPKYELELLNKYDRIIGIDEVGRGCWAGPVVIGAFIYTKDSKPLKSVNDSKQVTVKKRESLYLELSKNHHEIKVGEVKLIDSLGVAKTIEKLVLDVINVYDDNRTYFLIDGKFSQNFGEKSEKIIKGDTKIYSIAAASILAKVFRDKLMVQLDQKYKGFMFAKHKGYGTKLHREILAQKGICEIHRTSYKPIKIYSEGLF